MILLKRALLLTVILISFVSACMSVLARGSTDLTSIQNKLAALEASSGGRIGVSALNTATNTRIQYRAKERFPFCSTSKVIGVSAILKQSMTDSRLLQQKLTYKKEDLVAYSPITEKHLADGMTIFNLCAAAITQSDNTEMNKQIKKLGGLEAVTAFARSIGDNTFRLDRWEPKLNSAIPGDLRDTSTPAAMERSLQQLALSDALALPQRKQLQTWLKSNVTGNYRIRAGLPKAWIVGDKTGTGDYGTTNDIGIIWPPKRSPIVVAIYFTQNKKNAVKREDIIASVTHLLISN